MMQKSDGKKKALKQLLVCPPLGVKIESGIEIKTVVSVHDLSAFSLDDTAAVCVEDMRVLECMTKYPDLFGIEIITLMGVPGADYTPAFEQLVWQFDKISYDTLIVEMTTLNRMEQLKQAEKPKHSNNDLPSREDVLRAKTPSAIDWVKETGVDE